MIIQNGTLTVRGKMDAGSKPLDIFVDKGRLIFERESVEPNDERLNFNVNAFPALLGEASVASGKYLKGNFIVNGLVGLVGKTLSSPYAPKFFIYGKFTSLNTYARELANNRVPQLCRLLCPSSTDCNNNENSCVSASEIDLASVFPRRCDIYLGTGTDFSYCPTHIVSGGNTIDIDFFASPLIIIGQDYPSKLL